MDISPRWSTMAKAIVMLAILAVAGFLLTRFQAAVAPMIMAVILAYLLNPVVSWMIKHLRFSRPVAVLLIYAVLILLGIGLLSGAGLLIQQQFSGVLANAMAFINGVPVWLESLSAKPVQIGPWTLDLSATDITTLQNALIPTARDWIGRLTMWMSSAASGVAEFLAWAAFVFIVSFYMLNDLYALEGGFLRITPPDFRKDMERLLTELGPIWNAFLRGQLTLSLIMGTAVMLVMSILGLRYALILGLIAALMEFIPVIGPYTTAGTAILIALFQPENWMGFSPLGYTSLVAGAAILLQQTEANFLSPRVMGRHLRMQPAILIVGAFVGASLAGIPGLLLSGPLLATLRLFGRYVYAKLFDLPPWPDLEELRPLTTRETSVLCRPAQESDRGDILNLTTQIWEGHDYIPQLLDQWLADTEGILAVAELEGKAVGLGKLTRLGPEEWWLEGMRVHPGFQGQKIGSQLFEYLLHEWRKQGSGVIRLATSSERAQIHHLCDRLGFRRLAVLLVMSAPPIEEGLCRFEPLLTSDAESAAELAAKPETAWGAPGLVNIGWQWSRLSAERIADFARRGRAWWWQERTSALFLYDNEYDGKPGMEVAAILAPPKQLAHLLHEARILTSRLGAARLAWAAPNVPCVNDATKHAGFMLAWEARLWVFEHAGEPNP